LFTVHSSNNWAAGWYPEDNLPVELPYIDNFKPTGTGVSPLASDPEFVKVKCPQCGLLAKRETDVSDTFLDSAWYFLRYPSVGIESGELKVGNSKLKNSQFSILNSQLPWDRNITRKWLPVDMYIGGAEHAVLHLLYSRFLTMVFNDLKLVDFDEPFSKFRAHGLLIAEGAKMSKSKGNVVNPDEYIEKYGADTLRCYLMFCGRFTQGGDFSVSGIEGTYRFLKRVWRLISDWQSGRQVVRTSGSGPENPAIREPDSLHMMHKTIKKVTEDVESLDYNTAISAMMEWLNALEARTVNS